MQLQPKRLEEIILNPHMHDIVNPWINLDMYWSFLAFFNHNLILLDVLTYTYDIFPIAFNSDQHSSQMPKVL